MFSSGSRVGKNKMDKEPSKRSLTPLGAALLVLVILVVAIWIIIIIFVFGSKRKSESLENGILTNNTNVTHMINATVPNVTTANVTVAPVNNTKKASILTPSEVAKSIINGGSALQDNAKLNNDILRSEDLNYQQRLQSASNQAESVKNVAVVSKHKDQVVETEHKNTKFVSADKKDKRVAERKTEKHSPKKETVKSNDNSENFNYVFQVVSVAAESSADNVRKGLSKDGLSAKVVRAEVASRTVYRVYVSGEGSAEEINAVRDKIIKSGYQKAPLLVKKKKK